jgi:drug/metabolite transporter (DMT)-like permease
VQRQSLRDTTTLGILAMLLAVLMFSLNDVMGKWLASTYLVGQLLLLRGIAALTVLSIFIARVGWRVILDVSRPGVMAIRMVLTAVEVAGFYYAVKSMPLADAITFWMAAPIYVAALSPLLLGEKVGWRRWTAIGVGFVGVLIALRPSSETLSLPALVAILGSLAFSLMMIAGRALRASHDLALVFWPTLASGLFGGLLVLAGLATSSGGWVTPTPSHYVLLGLLGIVALAAHYFTNKSLILADASTVTPYQYTLLVWAMIFGWLFFDETPQATTLIGGGLIVASGLYIFFREQQLGKRAAEPAVEK